MENKAVFMTGIKQLEIRDVEMPEPKAGEVLIKLEYVGICGSDVHYLEFGKIGDFVVEGDFILGHECAGTVVSAGEGVSSLKPGDRVALEPGVTCGHCEFCKTGRYNLCPSVEFLATPPFQGSLSKYIAHPADMCFKLPENVSTKEGALVEPLAVGLHAAGQGGVKLGSTVVVLGAGCIGLVSLLACRAFGASDVTVVDVIPKRLEMAKKLGAKNVINAAEQDAAAELNKLHADGVDIVIEAAGNPGTIAQTALFVKNGGTVVLVGLAPVDVIPYNFAKIMNKEATIKSVFRYRNIYPMAINAIEGGFIDVSKIVTHEFSFEDTAKAFDFVINNKTEVVKAVIKT